MPTPKPGLWFKKTKALVPILIVDAVKRPTDNSQRYSSSQNDDLGCGHMAKTESVS